MWLCASNVALVSGCGVAGGHPDLKELIDG
jgi:hypothetical protein